MHRDRKNSSLMRASSASVLESIEGFSKEQVAAFDIIPSDAVVREFIGGSTIKIPHNE